MPSCIHWFVRNGASHNSFPRSTTYIIRVSRSPLPISQALFQSPPKKFSQNDSVSALSDVNRVLKYVRINGFTSSRWAQISPLRVYHGWILEKPPMLNQLALILSSGYSDQFDCMNHWSSMKSVIQPASGELTSTTP